MPLAVGATGSGVGWGHGLTGTVARGASASGWPGVPVGARGPLALAGMMLKLQVQVDGGATELCSNLNLKVKHVYSVLVLLVVFRLSIMIQVDRVVTLQLEGNSSIPINSSSCASWPHPHIFFY